mgnify:CR=1 FL=1
MSSQRRTRSIVLPPLHPAQIRVLQTSSRFKVLSCGRRWGKGVLTVTEWVKRAASGKKCRWISPSYASDSYQAGWAMGVNLARQIPRVEIRQQRHELDFSRIGGGWVQFRTAEEPDGLRGEGIDAAAFDEAAHIPHLQEIWEQCVRPSLMDRKGDAWFISTPKGFNYFHTLYKLAENGDKDWASFLFRTSDNPTIDAQEIAALRRSLPALVARQEVDAEFVQLAGALFKREQFQLVDAAPPVARWVRSWDLAWTTKTTSDYVAGVKLGLTEQGQPVVVHVVHERTASPVALIRDTARLDDAGVTQGIEVVGAQELAFNQLYSDPLLAGIALKKIEVHKDKMTRALPLLTRAEQSGVLVVRGGWDTQGFIDELCAFPEGQHDDQVDAASAALSMLAAPSGSIEERHISGIRYDRDTLAVGEEVLAL